MEGDWKVRITKSLCNSERKMISAEDLHTAADEITGTITGTELGLDIDSLEVFVADSDFPNAPFEWNFPAAFWLAYGISIGIKAQQNATEN
jgi:hypothetical protein